MTTREDRLFRRFCRLGDPDALAEVFDATAPDLLRLAHLLVGADAAEDLVQATFVDAIEGRERYDEARRVRPWLCGVLAMHAKRLRRARANEARALRAARPREAPSAPAAADDVETGEIAERLVQAIADLAEPYEPVARLHLRDGLSAREIAERLGRPAGTVRTQLVRALDRLRRQLPSLTPGVAMVGLRAPGAPHPHELEAVRARVLSRLGEAFAANGSSAGLGWVTGVLLMKKSAVVIGVLALVVVVGVLSLGGGAPLQSAGGPDPDPLVARSPVAASEDGAGTATADPTVAGGADDAPRTAVQEPPAQLLILDERGEPVGGRDVVLRVDERLRARGVTDAGGRLEFEELPADGRLQRGARSTRVGELPLVDGARVWATSAGSRVGGRVVDAELRPVPGAAVFCYRTRERRTDLLDPVTTTDGEGRFGFGVRDAGQVVLLVRADGHQEGVTRWIPVPSDDVVVRLRGGGRRLEGVALDPQGEPVPRARLALHMMCVEHRVSGDGQGRNLETWIDADDAGSFDVGWLPAGRGVIGFRDLVGGDAARRTPAAWIGRAGFDLRERSEQIVELRGAAAASLEVRFVDGRGEPLADASVSASDAGSHFAGRPLSTGGRTDDHGRVELRGVSPTRVRVVGRAGQLEAETTLDLVAGEQRQITLRAGATSHTLTLEFEDEAGARVYIVPLAARLVGPGGSISPRLTETYAIQFAGLPRPGPWTVLIRRSPVAGRWSRFEGLTAGPEPLRLVVRETAAAQAFLSVAGRIVGAAGAGDAEIEGAVLAMPVETGMQGSAVLSSGSFRFEQLPAGSYRLLLKSPDWWMKPVQFEVEGEDAIDLGEHRASPAAKLVLGVPALSAGQQSQVRILIGSAVSSEPMSIGEVERDTVTRDGWVVGRGTAPGRYRVVVMVPGYAPWNRVLDLESGLNRVSVTDLQRGTPVELRITCTAERPWRNAASGVLHLRDGAGNTVVHERVRQHFDDIDQRLVLRRLALPAGDYLLQVEESGKTSECSFTVGDSEARRVIELEIE